ncbi:MAG: adenosine kinase [Parcubacteria group bacterium Greene0416_79]|nr:MAG: adenosine kinase [Parcubacteria group bacterium Greene0416_79]
MKRPLVVGSVAFDLIFGIHGKIQDEILVGKDGKLGRQNLMFTAKTREHFFGGTGGNIAYGLGILGTKPLLFSLAGRDFERSGFGPHLKKAGVDSRVVVNEKSWTAVFYGMSDELGQQIGVYQPNAYERIDALSLARTIAPKEFESVGVAIFSAGTGKSIYRHMKEAREKCGKNTLIVFDPGQVISIFYDKTLLEKTLALADIFIGNEVEIKQLQTILGYRIEDVLRKGVRAVIETLGEKGSVIYEMPQKQSLAFAHGRGQMLKVKKTAIRAEKARRVVETTGAGDAYRAGLIAKLLEGKTLKQSCEFGARIAARSVAYRGAQTYRI